MLYNTVIHIPCIGAKTEKMLWSAGIHTWEDFIEPYPPQLSGQKINLIKQHLAQPYDEGGSGSAKQIAKAIGSSQSWRLFPHFREATAYLDIETTGLGGEDCMITSIALYDGASVSFYVQGENLDQFVDDVGRFAVLVTYNGKTFDVPVLERYFGITLDQIHIDLRYILRNLGFSGGLKGCEKQLGLHRGELDGLDGYFAVLLWQEYSRTGNRRALETLLAYNIEDAVNLETLMVHAYNLNVAKTPFAQSHRLPLPLKPVNPFRADLQIVNALKRAHWW